MRGALLTLAVLTAGLALFPAGASAQTDREISGGENRRLNGHNFIRPQYVESAFNNGSFGFTQGFGMYSFDNIGALSGEEKRTNIFLYYQELLAQIGILNYASLDLRAQGFAAIAGDIEDILGVGALANVDVGGFIRARIVTFHDIGLQIGAGLGVGYNRLLSIRPIALVNNTIETIQGNPDAVEEELIRSFASVGVSPEIMVAYGNGPFGAQVGIGMDIGIGLEDNSGTSYAVNPGLQLAFDIGHYTEVFPFALVGEYQLSKVVSEGGGTAHNLSGSVQFTGRQDMNLGLLFGAELDDFATLFYGTLAIHYYF